MSLVTLSEQVNAICSELSNLGWDSNYDLVIFKKNHALSVLWRLLEGEISPSQVEEWANAIEGREDIGFDNEHANVLQEFIYELANPSLTRALTISSAREWLSRLQEGQ